jgi:hypothetical protein
MDSFGTTALKLLQKRRPVVKTKVTLRITKAKRLPGSTRFLQFKSSWMLVRFCTHLAETVVEDPPWPPCNMINVSCVAGLQRPSARSTSSTGIRSVRT